MKKIIFLAFLLLLLACEEDYTASSRMGYSPVLLTREKLEGSIKWEPARSLEEPGKIYLFGDYLLVNEKRKGVHVFDNSNPSNPLNTGFIRIPGNIDIAVKDSVLYADNAVDLVAIDISTPGSVSELDRENSVFSELFPPGLNYLPYEFEKGKRPENTIIVDWIKETK
jgi:hypothetical protein